MGFWRIGSGLEMPSREFFGFGIRGSFDGGILMVECQAWMDAGFEIFVVGEVDTQEILYSFVGDKT